MHVAGRFLPSYHKRNGVTTFSGICITKSLSARPLFQDRVASPTCDAFTHKWRGPARPMVGKVSRPALGLCIYPPSRSLAQAYPLVGRPRAGAAFHMANQPPILTLAATFARREMVAPHGCIAVRDVSSEGAIPRFHALSGCAQRSSHHCRRLPGPGAKANQPCACVAARQSLRRLSCRDHHQLTAAALPCPSRPPEPGHALHTASLSSC